MKLATICILSIAFIIICTCTAGCLGYILPQEKEERTVINYVNELPAVTPQPVVVKEVQTAQIAPVVYKPAPIVLETVKIQPSPTIINSQGNSGWISYYNPNNGFRIYKPSTWKVTTLKNDVDAGMTGETVYITSLDQKLSIMIFGMETAGTINEVSLVKDEIPDVLYDQFILGLENPEDDAGEVSGVVRDNNFYTINGDPARHVSFQIQYPVKKVKGEAYVICHDTKYFVVMYMADLGCPSDTINIAKNIMNTFDGV